MRVLFWLAALLLAAVLAAFAVSNRAAVTLGLWPLPFVREVPLYLPILLALLLGFVAGAATMWLAARTRRRESRRRRRRITVLERELTATQAQLPARSTS
jgi:putative membrane protein